MVKIKKWTNVSFITSRRVERSTNDVESKIVVPCGCVKQQLNVKLMSNIRVIFLRDLQRNREAESPNTKKQYSDEREKRSGGLNKV